jgi:plastocyanin
MRTGLLRLYGKKDTVQEYIDAVIKHFGLSKEIRDIALNMFNYIAKNTSFRGLAPSMQAMTLVKLAAEKKGHHIKSRRWSTISSYNTLLKHSRDFEKILEKRETDMTKKHISRRINETIQVSDTVTSSVIKRVIIPPNFTNSELEVNYFIPRFVKVLKGQKVEWVNLDTHTHDLKFYEVLHNEAKFLFDLGQIETKEKSTIWKFDYDPSRIDYFCTLHNNEIGTIVIYPTPEDEMTNKEQFEFLSKVFDIKPAPSLSHLVSRSK